MTNEVQQTAAHTPAGATDCSCGEHFQTGRGLQNHLRNVNRVTSPAGGWETYDGRDHQLGHTLLMEAGTSRVLAEFKDATADEMRLAAAAPALLEALEEQSRTVDWLIEYLVDQVPEIPNLDHTAWASVLREHEIARAAIAQARGEE